MGERAVSEKEIDKALEKILDEDIPLRIEKHIRLFAKLIWNLRKDFEALTEEIQQNYTRKRKRNSKGMFI